MSFCAFMSAGRVTNGAAACVVALPSRTGTRSFLSSGAMPGARRGLPSMFVSTSTAKGLNGGLGLVGFQILLARLFSVVVGSAGNRRGHRLGRLLAVSNAIMG